MMVPLLLAAGHEAQSGYRTTETGCFASGAEKKTGEKTSTQVIVQNFAAVGAFHLE